VRAGVEIQNAALVDLAPTILHLMGEEVPAHMDGRVLTEVLRDDVTPIPRKRSTPTTPTEHNGAGPKGDVLSAEEQKILAERLRSLGYVG
jgi:arylsulfatase A-like enzyme